MPRKPEPVENIFGVVGGQTITIKRVRPIVTRDEAVNLAAFLLSMMRPSEIVRVVELINTILAENGVSDVQVRVVRYGDPSQ